MFDNSPLDEESVRIVVVGDSGVGKTDLVKWLSTGAICSPEASTRTIGCNLALMAHRFQRSGKEYFVEIIDVAGRSKHPRTRSALYYNITGVILVHDLSNRKSYEHLEKWMNEVQSELVNDGSPANTRGNSMSRSYGGLESIVVNSTGGTTKVDTPHAEMPVLVVGTKLDLTSSQAPRRIHPCPLAQQFGGQSIDMSSKWSRSSTPLETEQTIATFLDSLIASKFFPTLSLRK
eukprot:Partr_v1_DN25813_c1_g1_i7_m2642 putative RAB, member of RAS oncogene family-like 3